MSGPLKGGGSEEPPLRVGLTGIEPAFHFCKKRVLNLLHYSPVFNHPIFRVVV